jgi:hypothetical protein
MHLKKAPAPLFLGVLAISRFNWSNEWRRFCAHHANISVIYYTFDYLSHRSTHLKRCMCVFSHLALAVAFRREEQKEPECVTYFAARSRFYMKYSKQCALIYQNALASDEMMSVCRAELHALPVEFLAINLMG